MAVNKRLGDFEEHSTYSSALFVEHLVKAFPCPIECI